MRLSLYIHFPFCKQKCLYCDFVSSPCCTEEIEAYCDALIAEIQAEAANYPDALIDTVFFGGGTPSVVSSALMEKILAALHSSFRFTDDVEFTSEANPGTLTQPWLETMRGGGMNRLSLGVQAAQDEILRSIGRIHTVRQAEKAIQMAQAEGFRNINADLMFALPGQSLRDYLNSIRWVSEQGVTHISAYSLILEEGTPLEKLVQEGKCKLPDEDLSANMYEKGIELLEKLGLHRYEISNFARDGYRCRHNIGYWQGTWYLGLGVAAHSMLPPKPSDWGNGIVRIRRDNLPDRDNYIAAARNGNFATVRQQELIHIDEAAFETVMLSLRTTDGLDEEAFLNNYGITFRSRYPQAVESLIAEGLAEEKKGRFILLPRGLEVQNSLLVRFMKP